MIQIGKAIYNILSSDSNITGYTTSIYPLVIPKEIALPVIVYERRTDPETTKDNNTLYNTIVDVTVLDDDYGNGLDIATAVQSALEHYSGTNSGVIIRDIDLAGVDEQYAEDAYIQKITFNVKSV